MRNGMRFLFLSFLLLIAGGMAGIQAEDGVSRKWAVSVSGIVTNPVAGKDPMDRRISSWSGSGPEITGELYLPYKTSVLAGYYRESNQYFGGDVERNMSGILLGGRKYFLNSSLWIQPYAGINTYFNWNERREYGTMEFWSTGMNGQTEMRYKRESACTNPVFSIAPAAGLDLYIFSCVALTVQYDFRIGTGSSMYARTSGPGFASWTVTGKGMRHALMFGIKATFPFRFTGDDGQGLIGVLADILFDRLSDSSSRRASFVY